MQIYTVGYGGRKPQDFGALLRQYGVETIVDVRLRPDRASIGLYAKAKTPDKGIQRLLVEHGIGYVSLQELGNVFMGCEDWHERYQRLMTQAGDVLCERLLNVPGRWSLMCAERQAAACHRALIAEHLTGRGYRVEHILEA